MNTETNAQALLLGITDEAAIQGLGRVLAKHAKMMRPGMDPGAMPKEVIDVAREAAADIAVQSIKSNSLTRDQQIFATKISELDSNDREVIAKGNANFVDGDRYFRVQLTAPNGTQELTKDRPTAKAGITNLHEAALPKGVNMLVSRISVAVGNKAGANVDGVDYANVFDAGADPNAVFNGEIEISAAGRTILPSTPLRKFFAIGGVAQVNANNGLVEVALAAPKLVRGGELIDITFRGAVNGTLYAADNTFIEVRLIGPETGRKS